MKISEFISNYKNHPVLFIGTGFSLRYIKNSYTWDGLLRSIAEKLKGTSEFYLDIKSNHEEDGEYLYCKIAEALEKEFTSCLMSDREGQFKEINDKFYALMDAGKKISRLKLYISEILSTNEIRPQMEEEIIALKKTRKNIGSIITTNYDNFAESIFEFNPLIGNDILLSNPYGSVYKVHGCIKHSDKIIITSKDYEKFSAQYELIRAQLLSLFIHNPIIFIGYSITDRNIKDILKTIFTYVEPNSDIAEKIRGNFLLVEYSAGSTNLEISDHDINLEGHANIIRINKIKTDNFLSIYNSISELKLPVSAMDIRKVQSIVKEIYSGGTIQVKITDDLDSLQNSEKILAIGSNSTIKYEYQTSSEMIRNYFSIIEEENFQLISLIDKFKIPNNNFFPIFGFNEINKNLTKSEVLKNQQLKLIKNTIDNMKRSIKNNHKTVDEILSDASIPAGGKDLAVMYGIASKNIRLEDARQYIQAHKEQNLTPYRKLICAYDAIKYSAVGS
jgi:hypothetical protein